MKKFWSYYRPQSKSDWAMFFAYIVLLLIAFFALFSIDSDADAADEAPHVPHPWVIQSVSGSRVEGFHLYRSGYDTWYPPLPEMLSYCGTDHACRINTKTMYAAFAALTHKEN